MKFVGKKVEQAATIRDAYGARIPRIDPKLGCA